jgi:5-methylcytosine-specific restriction protein A
MPDLVPTYRPAYMQAERSVNRRIYDRMRRRKAGSDREAIQFYDSQAWDRLRQIRLSMNPWCMVCESRGIGEPATIVHHIKEVRTHWELRLELDNTQSLCRSCHSRLHAIQ